MNLRSDFLVSMLIMLVSRPSLLAHKLLMFTLMLKLAFLVKTRLDRKPSFKTLFWSVLESHTVPKFWSVLRPNTIPKFWFACLKKGWLTLVPREHCTWETCQVWTWHTNTPLGTVPKYYLGENWETILILFLFSLFEIFMLKVSIQSKIKRMWKNFQCSKFWTLKFFVFCSVFVTMRRWLLWCTDQYQHALPENTWCKPVPKS